MLLGLTAITGLCLAPPVRAGGYLFLLAGFHLDRKSVV